MYCRKCGLKLNTSFCPACTKVFFRSKRFRIPVILIVSLLSGLCLITFIRLSQNPWDYLIPSSYKKKFYEMYINSKSLTIRGKRIYFWQKTIPSTSYSIPYNCDSYDLSYEVIDCEKNSEQTLKRARYDSNSNIIENSSYREDLFLENNVLPGSYGEIIKNKVCQNLNPIIRLKNLIIPQNMPNEYPDCE